MMYASNTVVPVGQSKAQIEQLLQHAGAKDLCMASSPGVAMVGFIIKGLGYKIILPLTDPKSCECTPTGRKRKDVRLVSWHCEQSDRARWRALLLIVKAKLEAVSLGITTTDREFAADLVMQDGRTLHQHLSQHILSGQMPKALPFVSGE